jgi:hypothetical protein
MPKVWIRSIHVMFHVYKTRKSIDTVFLSIETTRCHLAFFCDEMATTDDHKTCKMCSRAYIGFFCMSWRYMHVHVMRF